MVFHRNGGSSTCVIEPVELQDVSSYLQQPDVAKVAGSRSSLRIHETRGSEEAYEKNDPVENLPSPTIAGEAKLERWNAPRTNLYRTLAAFWSFVVMGSNDAAYGALIPYMQEYYNLTFIVISLVFLSPLAGYTTSALLNNAIHLKFGQRGIAFIAPICHLVAYIVIAVHPPYPVLVIIFMLAGFGNGLADAGWNAWMGNMANANEVLGFLHASYGLGAVLSPLIATTMITKGNKLPWYNFYYVMISMAFLEGLFLISAFWGATGAVFRANNPRTTDTKDNRLKEALVRMPYARVTWICAIFLLGYVGVEVALGGWIVKFMLEVRKGGNFASGMTATGFWMGMTVGRVVLGFVTPKLGEKLAIAVSLSLFISIRDLRTGDELMLTNPTQMYLPITMALELIFWLVPQFYVSAVAVGFQGFFLGPMFPAAVVAATKLLPRHLHVSAIGFAAAFGSSGAAIFPFAVGAIAQAKGVQVLQPIILALLVVVMGLWLSLPRFRRKED
ncbi:MFS general substrate transporter [Lophiostoma macrostomum CBS 122681]|uniref:MFS general substrate transporter n=1 Tax=Lophiostoma macrostomum CBS 122681 TaxID=1314788 RepID=A0A6A6TMR4_9PLEO|nr:MFS general substrate transporter [Lophiostoma macrostomum CBS 122681]